MKVCTYGFKVDYIVTNPHLRGGCMFLLWRPSVVITVLCAIVSLSFIEL